MRQPDNLPAFCRVHRNGRPLIGRSVRPGSDAAALHPCTCRTPTDKDLLRTWWKEEHQAGNAAKALSTVAWSTATGAVTSATPPGAKYLRLAHGYIAAQPDGIVRYTAHELRHVCASLLIASGASDMQVAHQMGHSKIETTKNIYGHMFVQDRAAILDAMNQAVSRLHVYESQEPNAAGDGHAAA